MLHIKQKSDLLSQAKEIMAWIEMILSFGFKNNNVGIIKGFLLKWNHFVNEQSKIKIMQHIYAKQLTFNDYIYQNQNRTKMYNFYQKNKDNKSQNPSYAGRNNIYMECWNKKCHLPPRTENSITNSSYCLSWVIISHLISGRKYQSVQ